MIKDSQIEMVSKVQKYIEDNYQKPLTLYELAKVAGYSPWHFAKIFKKHTGKTCYSYVKSYRLSKAALLLRDENLKVLDVALDFVFDSHEGFTRAFSKEFGVSPKRYSTNPIPIRLFLPHDVKSYYLYLNKEDTSMEQSNQTIVFTQIIEREQRKLLLKRGVKAKDYFEYCEEVGCDVWGVLTSVKEALYEPVGLWLPEHLRAGKSTYAQGVELPYDYAGAVPEGFELIDLPACTLMVFQGEPFEDEAFDVAIKDVWKAINRYDPTPYGYEWAQEEAPRIQLEPQGERGYIEALPVKRILKAY